jgi:transcriptional regulator with XRE-family HTH domain
MGFSDISSRFKKASAESTPAEAVTDYAELYAIRARMLGVLIQDARHASGFSIEQLAQFLKLDPATVQGWEYGDNVPSLPQIELMAYILQVPVSHFWGTETFEKRREEHLIDAEEYALVRDRMVGVLLNSARQAKGITIEALAASLSLHPDDISRYESGELAIPMNVLTSISSAVGVSMSYFLEDNGRVGQFLEIQEMGELFTRMPDDIRQFLAVPSHEAYIRVAMALAKMPTESLRGLAEGLIDITM